MTRFLRIVFIIALVLTLQGPVFARHKSASPKPAVLSEQSAPQALRVVGADATSKDVVAIMATYADLVQACNQKRIDDAMKHYHSDFLSGDNFTREQLRSMIVDTWQAYPNIQYNSQAVELRVYGDWAALQSLDKTTALAPADKDIIDVPGTLASESSSILYFRRFGADWQITSDATVWEQAVVRYGVGDTVKMTLSAPEQVRAGDGYSATLQAQLPAGVLSIAHIDNQPIRYPHPKADGKFRTLNPDNASLQRVLKANTENRNEVVSAVVTLTKIDQKDPERPSVSVAGVISILKRVNVVPTSQEASCQAAQATKTTDLSASGKIDATKIPAEPVFDDEAGDDSDAAPSPPNNEGE